MRRIARLTLLPATCCGLFLLGCKPDRTAMPPEVESNLNGLFVANKSHFGEFGGYGSDLLQVHWMPYDSPEYVYGFCDIELPAEMVAYPPDFDNARSHTAHQEVINRPGGDARYSTERMQWLGDQHPCDLLERLGLRSQFYVRPTAFQAFAIGQIDDDPDFDVWAIDNHRQTSHLMAD